MELDGLVPASEGICIRERLHRIIDDLEMITKQLAEIVTVPREERMAAKEANAVELTRLFKIKEQELEETLKIAAEQAERQKVIEQLEQEVRKRDEYLVKIQNCLRDAERLMTNAVFQANQKLKSIASANHQKVSAEELIRYAHRISASNAVAAPLTWQQGDPQRPFPTDVEMRSGLLSRLGSGELIPPNMLTPGMISSSAVSSTPPMMASGSVGPPGPGSMHSFMPPGPPSAHPPEMTSFSPHHRPFSPSGVFQGAPNLPPGAMMPPRSVPTGWVAQRALTPPNVSPRALRLPPPPFHPGMQQMTPPVGYYVGGPVSPASAVSSPLSAMHHQQAHLQPGQQHPLVQSTPPISFQQQPPFGARVSPQVMPLQQHIRPQMAPHTPRQTSPASARMVKEEFPGIHQTDTVELLSSDSSSSSSSDSPD